MAITGQKVTSDEFKRNKALAEAIATAFGDLITQRTQDLPHRFKAPASFGEYLADYAVNQSYYHQLPITYNTSAPLMLQVTTRPTQKILELIFVGPDGMRLFNLEIEYGDAVQAPRK